MSERVMVATENSKALVKNRFGMTKIRNGQA